MQACACFVLPALRHCEDFLQFSHGFLHGVVRGQTHTRVDKALHELERDTLWLVQGEAHLIQPAGLLQLLLQSRQLW